ncbi:protein amnionless-like [Hetaerina americana]|uniref:protein amnionless-like n=1 Tax=Hetaerina americana TaxID=62018 RepID=UPI003A7F3DA9
MNPRSWAPEDENSNALINSPVPHAEQIPCEHDKVVFPSGSNFRVILPRVSTAIGSLIIEGQALDTEAWRVMTESNVGRMQFIGDPNVIAILGEDGADHPCRNPTGCYCGNGGSITMGRVCSYAGATIQLEYLPHAFVFSALEDHVHRFTSSDVKAHVGKTSATTNHVQIVLVDAGSYQERSVESGKRLLKVLNNDMSLGVGKITFEASGPALDLSEMYISHSPEKIVGFIFAGCALLVLAFLLFLAYRDTRFTGTEAPPFVFSRFDNMSSRSEGPVIRVWGEGVAKEAVEEKEFDQAQEASDWVTMESILAPSQPQAFDNPMYNKQLEVGASVLSPHPLLDYPIKR